MRKAGGAWEADYCELPGARAGSMLTFTVGRGGHGRYVTALTVPALLKNSDARAAVFRLAAALDVPVSALSEPLTVSTTGGRVETR